MPMVPLSIVTRITLISNEFQPSISDDRHPEPQRVLQLLSVSGGLGPLLLQFVQICDQSLLVCLVLLGPVVQHSLHTRINSRACIDQHSLHTRSNSRTCIEQNSLHTRSNSRACIDQHSLHTRSNSRAEQSTHKK